jgi:hypothetical protein
MKVKELAKLFIEMHYDSLISMKNNDDVISFCTSEKVMKLIQGVPNLTKNNTRALETEILSSLEKLKMFAVEVFEFVKISQQEKGLTQPALCLSPNARDKKQVSPIDESRDLRMNSPSPVQTLGFLRPSKSSEGSFRNRQTSDSRLSPDQNDMDVFARELDAGLSPKKGQ